MDTRSTETGVQAVIFDMDGVLIDSSDAHFESWQRLAADLGQEVTREQFRATFGRQSRDIIPILLGISDPRQIATLDETKERYYRDIIRHKVPVLPGAAALVRACHQAGMKCAIGSSAPRENVIVALRAMSIEPYLDAVVSGEDVTIGKPAPQVFLIAAERVGTAPSACTVVEDAPAGIEAALRAGMRAIGIAIEHPADRLAGAHLVVNRIDELTPEMIRRARPSA